MSNPEPVFVASTITAAVGAVVTIAQAVPSIDKRLGRLRDIEREIGRFPPLLRLYVWPQYCYKYGLIAITLLGMVMVGAFGYTILYPTASLNRWFEALKDGGVWLVAAWLVLGAAMYTNAFSWILIAGWRTLTWPFPIRHMLGIRRPKQHPAWSPLCAFVELNENARPLVISPINAAAFADWLIRTIRQDTTAPPNRASAPTRPSGMTEETFREQVGNALLMGCIVEGAHYRNPDFPRRDWGGFYDAIEEIATQTSVLSAATVKQRYFQNDYYEALMADLNARLATRSQAAIPDSPALVEMLRRNFGLMVERYSGTAACIDPQRDGWFRSRSETISTRVKELPLWDDEGMRAQFVKLAIVWHVWRDFPIGEFDYPFAKSIATLMLDRGVIKAPEDVKVLSFDEANDRMVAGAAEKMVVANAINLIEDNIPRHQSWLPVESRGTGGEVLRWWIAYELDFRMWDYANRMNKGQKVGDAEFTRWQLSQGQVTRVKKS